MRKIREDQEAHNLDELFERYRQSPESYAFVPLADACRKMGRIDEALEICESGVKRHPGYPSGHVVKGKCLFDRGNRAGAREAFERVLLLDEHNLVALKYLGMIEADDGNLGVAEKHLQQILSLDPENKEIKAILSLVEEQEQIDRATEEPIATMEAVDEILADVAPPREAEGNQPDDAAPSLSIAGDIPSTAGSAVRGDDVETSDELASVTLADIFASQGYTSKAAKIYGEVLRKQPSNDMVRARLQGLTGGSVDVAEPTDTDKPVDTGKPAEKPGSEDPSRLPEIGENNPPPGEALGVENMDQPLSEGFSAPQGEPEPALGPPAAAAARRRPEIAEKDSLNHFRHWLTKLYK